ncbi:phospholipase D family protein [Niastella sp. OAS944]|uniref:phospholipase D family protein n=1 Tax=Niastella sp. OAS944 TaxID=2664089 RepID=UPI00347BE8F2|nr:phosphatidylserine/phosphatidylglycerophosphate/cardiolipin synthase-like enzyme [Chitinophagaceae bacterium OAS944]
MPEFLTTRGVSNHIEDIIIKSKSKLILISPFLKLSRPFFQRLKDATIRGVKITIVYGKNKLSQEEQTKLEELPNVQVFYCQDLHAKCYFNEVKMVITSMNMYEFSEINNREMGVLIDRTNDKKLFEDAMEETKSILQSAIPNALRLPKQSSLNKNTKEHRNTSLPSHHGYCIRCESPITYNPNKPYCPDCFDIWSEYENLHFLENVCHCCGSEEGTSMNKPLCRRCFSEWHKQQLK